jgi:8-oxo-dGTP pyrophosphatase MutT (NUDIX family)
MKKVVKVIMYVYRNNNGKKEFFVLHRQKGDVVVLTGHVGDREDIKNETLEQAAAREVEEELGVKPKALTNLNFSVDVYIKEKDVQSQENAFLIEIPNQDVHFLEGNENHQWHSLEELSEVLTYLNQKKPLEKVDKLL